MKNENKKIFNINVKYSFIDYLLKNIDESQEELIKHLKDLKILNSMHSDNDLIDISLTECQCQYIKGKHFF